MVIYSSSYTPLFLVLSYLIQQQTIISMLTRASVRVCVSVCVYVCLFIFGYLKLQSVNFQ